MKTAEADVKTVCRQIVMVVILAASCVNINARGMRDREKPAAAVMADGTVTAADRITGQLVIFGSAPKTFPGLVTADGKQYSLKMAPDGPSMRELFSHSGEKLECTGRIEASGISGPGGFETLKDGTFILNSYRVLHD
jgi:hypothetical protein